MHGREGATLKSMNAFSIREALTVGWTKTKQNFLLWIMILVTMAVVNMAAGWLDDQVDSKLLSTLLALGGYVIQLGLELGIIGVALKLLADQTTKYSDLFTMYGLVPQFFLATIIGGIAVMLGLLVFVIPGIYIALRLSQTAFLIADWKLSGIDALKKSWEITRGNTLQLFFLVVVVSALNLIGGFLFLVGLLVTVPVTTLAMAYVYRKIAPGGAITPAPVNAIVTSEAIA